MQVANLPESAMDQGSATGHRPVAVRLPITDPRSNVVATLLNYKHQLDQGSVLIVGKVRSKITSQPEVVPLINSLYDPLHCLYEFVTDLILFSIY